MHSKKLRLILNYADKKLRALIDHYLESSVEVAAIIDELMIVLENKYNLDRNLTKQDLIDIKEALNVSYREILKFSKKETHDLERVMRDLVLTFENYLTYNHISDITMGFFDTLKYAVTNHHLEYSKLQTKEAIINNKKIDRMIDKAEDLSIVYLSNELIHRFGHTALKIGNQGYVQIINGIYIKPHFYTNEQWRSFMKFSNYETLGIQEIHVPDLPAAKEKIKTLCKEKWFWRPITHNCAHFVWKILEAGNANIDYLKKPYNHKENRNFIPVLQLATVPIRELIKTDPEKNIQENGPKQVKITEDANTNKMKR